MKKIDLHIHTKQSISDYEFDFSLEKLKEYVSVRKLDCIAITNHNLFDYEQYKLIKQELDIVVFPGIEVDLENGHILLISENEDIADFISKCSAVEKLIKTSKDTLTIDQFTRIFTSLDKYLVIPHYIKSPELKPQFIELLKPHIFCGEVQSEKKFHQCIKDTEKLVPVLFSDERISDSIEEFSFRQMYIDTEELKMSDLKICFSDKSKVSLSLQDGNELFQILENGFSASTGLNVILGERSSGKTVTLNSISKAFKNVKYIRQFSLIEKDEKKEDEAFKKRIKTKKAKLFEDYLAEFKVVVDDVNKIDRNEETQTVEKYITSLKKYAADFEKRDIFSKTKLFTETEYSIKELESLQKLIEATELLMTNIEYRSIIDTHLSLENLRNLLFALIDKYKEYTLENKKKEIVNQIVRLTKDSLSIKTGVTAPLDCQFKELYIDDQKIKKFNEIVTLIKTPKVIASSDLYDFKIIAATEVLENAKAVGAEYGKRVSFADAYEHFSNPYGYLCKLKEIQSVPETEFYKLFIKLSYKILNRYGADVSGGERSEFNLLNELTDAKKYDMLLIDEPESSFDNLFLNSSVNSLIKEVASDIPVFVVTHNNTVGESIKPNYIIYTKREIIDSEPLYKVYGGHPSSSTLKTVEGEEIKNFMVLMDCLEGGIDTFEERKRTYEILQGRK